MFDFWKKYLNDPYRKMGFYSDQKGILRRYYREKKYWETHLQACKHQILESASTKSKDNVAILGSGWLLDVPIDELLELYTEVWLFDISHPKELVRKYGKHQSVHFVRTDISGYGLPLYKLCQSFREINFNTIEHLKPEFDFKLDDFDYVVSCNILDQLDDLLVSYALAKSNLSEKFAREIRKIIQSAHIAILPLGKSLIITDIKELQVSHRNEVVQETPLIYCNTADLKQIDHWIWKFDNTLMYRSNVKTWFNVRVFEK